MPLPADVRGAGESVLLLHAGIADRRMWAEHLEWLSAAGYRAVAVDLPGFGEAPVSPGPQAPWLDVLGTMDALGIERATVVGNSFGGAVALRMAAVAPARIAALLLVSAPAPDLSPSPELSTVWDAEAAALERADIDAAVIAVVEGWLAHDAPRELRDRVARMQRRAFEIQTAAETVTDAPDPLDADPDALSRLAIPALLAAGEHDMPDFRRSAERLARVIPGARQALIPDAGHLAPLEAPEAFRRLLLDFLSEPG